MNSIIYDDEIITPENDICQYYYYYFLNKLNKRDYVKLALFCAKINNSKKSNVCIELVEKWLKDENLVNRQELYYVASAASVAAAVVDSYVVYSVYYAADTAYTISNSAYSAAWYAAGAVYAAANIASAYVIDIDKVNKYLQILLRKTKQFQNNKILEQIRIS